MKITITGGTGRLAQHVIKELEHDHELLLFDRVPPVEGRRDDLPLILGDLNHPEDCRKAVKDADAVIHLGAIPYATDIPGIAERVKAFGGTPYPFDETMRSNTNGTWQVLSAARDAKVGLFIMATTGAILGWGCLRRDPSLVKYLPFDENHPPVPEYSYGLSKLLDEHMLQAFTRAFEMRTYAIRPAAINSVERLQERAQKTGPATGWVNNFYVYVAVQDISRAFRLCLEAANELPLHEVFNVTAADSVAHEDSQELVTKFYPELKDKAAGLTGRQSFVSSAKAESLFGYQAKHSWTDYL